MSRCRRWRRTGSWAWIRMPRPATSGRLSPAAPAVLTPGSYRPRCTEMLTRGGAAAGQDVARSARRHADRRASRGILRACRGTLRAFRGILRACLGTQRAGRATQRAHYRGKRLLDLAILGLAAIPALVLGAICAAAILISGGSPVLFRQLRAGRDGGPFVLFKLRTMAGAQRRGDAFPEPARITRIGRLLRRMSMDELPQLINVLRGEMSLVGPRPTLSYQVLRYDPRQLRRLRVRPGLTGLAQVNGRNRMSWTERIEWDLRYVENQSLRLDLA